MNMWQLNGGTVKSTFKGGMIDNKDKLHMSIHSGYRGGGKFGDARDTMGSQPTMPRRAR